MRRVAIRIAITAPLLVGCGAPAGQEDVASLEREPVTVRIALFNIRELRTEKILEVDADGRGANPQALAAARIIRHVRPDILVLNEIDHDYDSEAEGLDLNARRFRDLYLAGGEDGLELPWSFAAPNNTGLLSGVDLDGDGHVATAEDRGERVHGNDAYGYGTYPGEYSMAVLSRYPILGDEARTFQHFLWRDLAGNHLPPGHFSDEALEVFRLSSKSHWDLPIDVDGRRVHLFASHPTPQGFDGEEDRNGRRNFDEIKLWVDYVNGTEFLVDDAGSRGGYRSLAPFVVIGDLNAAPLVESGEGDSPFRTSVYEGVAAIDQIVGHSRIQDSGPLVTSGGALMHRVETPREAGPPRYFERSTSVFGEGSRIDYILPSVDLEMVDGGVFWPVKDELPEQAAWADEASDHRLVWLDVRFRAPRSASGSE